MSRITSHVEVGSVVAEKTPDGGSFYRRDKYIHLTQQEWDKLFSLELSEEKIGKILLDENSQTPKFVGVEFYNGHSYIDIRHCVKRQTSIYHLARV